MGGINKPKKPMSKRVPTKLRSKIQKASVAKQRKERKLAKKNPEWRSKLKKDPGIPNLFPYKEKLLQEIDQKRMKKLDEAQARKEQARAAKAEAKAAAANPDAMDQDEDEDDDDESDGNEAVDEDDEDDDAMDEDDGNETNAMAALVASARKAAEAYDKKLQSDGEDDSEEEEEVEEEVSGKREPNTLSQMSSRRAFDKIFKDVVDQADVVLYVLDARDPQATRSLDVERSVMAAAGGGKRLILILNKIDLIPHDVLEKWLVYLRRYFPTLPLRASLPAANAHTFHHKDLTVQSTSTALFQALKAYAAKQQLKRAVSVGVIGYPNVGKSSVINALLSRMSGNGGKRSTKACPAGAEAGVTTSIRNVKIDNKLILLDSPGVIFPTAAGSSSTEGTGMVSVKKAADTHAHLVLLNAVPPRQIDDPFSAVSLLMRRLEATSPDLLQKLYEYYAIPALVSSQDMVSSFLVHVARKRGRLGRGGVPNVKAAAMTVVTDWRDGRIQGWTEPPSPTNTNTGATTTLESSVEAALPDQKQIVTEWAAEFSLEGLWGQ